MADKLYERIGGSTRSITGVFSLWLGDGHVLQVAAAFGVETYRRWYLCDIQALIVRRTSRRAMWNLAWGIIGGLAFAGTAGVMGLAAASGKERETRIALQVFAGIGGAVTLGCAAIMLWNSLLGPTCTIFVQTPTGLAPLAAPTRRRTADLLMAKLRPLIDAAQRKDPITPPA